MIRFLVPQLRANPAIVWELATSCGGMAHPEGYRRWIHETARGLIKSLRRANSSRPEARETASPWTAGLDIVLDHRSPDIDFVTCHLWAQNWGWVRAESLAEDYPRRSNARRYVSDQVARAEVLGKPIVLEEFGFPRDEPLNLARRPGAARQVL